MTASSARSSATSSAACSLPTSAASPGATSAPTRAARPSGPSAARTSGACSVPVRATSRDRLLVAARELFAERGFERTTTRDIGEQAGVDAALIARHFGSKTGLYVASLREADDGPLPPLTVPGRVEAMLERLDRGGPGPVFQAAVQRHEDAAVQAEAAAELRRRLVVPLMEGGAAPLEAEVVVAAFAGIALARSAGSLPALQEAGVSDVVRLVDLVIRALL